MNDDYTDSLLADSHEAEKVLFKKFIENHLTDTLRIVSTKQIRNEDVDLLYEALCVVLAIYMTKVHSGEIITDRVLH